MRRCAFLTLAEPGHYVVDDDLAHGPLHALGWRVESVPWAQPDVEWASYDAVVIRSTYDYVTAPDAFLRALARIDDAGTPLFNSLELVRWNLRKTYLDDLAQRGVPTVPTLWHSGPRSTDIEAFFDELAADEIVIKPVVGANASGAFRLDRRAAEAGVEEFDAFYARRDAMVQPFVRAIVEEGEYSLFYFDGELSHAIRKTPKDADFRVQEEHGGLIRPITPTTAIRAAGDRAIAALEETPLYARTDLVRFGDGDDFRLMELELIEPSLYFRADDGAARRFARALDGRVSRAAAGPRPGRAPR